MVRPAFLSSLAILMAFAEALTHLLIDPLERERMGMRGRERVRKYFTAERMSQETLLLYEDLLRRRSACEINRLKHFGFARDS